MKETPEDYTLNMDAWIYHLSLSQADPTDVRGWISVIARLKVANRYADATEMVALLHECLTWMKAPYQRR